MLVTVCINPVLDLLFESPTGSEEARSFFGSTEFRCGGFGPNVARALERQGHPALSLLVTGGSTGHLIESALREEGLPFESFHGSEETRIAVHEIAGSKTRMLVSPSPRINHDEIRKLFDRVIEITGPEDWILIGGSAQVEAEEIYLECVRAVSPLRNCCLDIRTEHWMALASAGPRILKIPEKSVAGPYSEVEQQLSLARSNGAQLVLASVPGEGLLAATEEGLLRVAPLTVSMVNPFGAGDCLMATLAAELYSGSTTSCAIKRAVAAATASVQKSAAGDFDPHLAKQIFPRVLLENSGPP